MVFSHSSFVFRIFFYPLDLVLQIASHLLIFLLVFLITAMQSFHFNSNHSQNLQKCNQYRLTHFRLWNNCFTGCILSSTLLILMAITKCNVIATCIFYTLSASLRGVFVFGLEPALVDMSPKFCGNFLNYETILIWHWY